MNERTFKQRICEEYGLGEEQYLSFTLNRILFRRLRLLSPVVGIFYPDHLLNEKRLVETVGEAVNMKEIRDEIDFYQHKFVVNHFFKDVFRFRLSGRRLLSLASQLFVERT